MRGELDDALERMARREELQRRLAAEESANANRSPVDEVAEAVRRVVAQYPTLAVALWITDGTAATQVRVGWSAGAVTVSPAPGPAESNGGGGQSQPNGTAGPALHSEPVPEAEAPQDPNEPVGQPARSAPPAWPLTPSPQPSPQPWSPAVETSTSDPAARLAELIRQNPSLLSPPDDRP